MTQSSNLVLAVVIIIIIIVLIAILASNNSASCDDLTDVDNEPVKNKTSNSKSKSNNTKTKLELNKHKVESRDSKPSIRLQEQKESAVREKREAEEAKQAEILKQKDLENKIKEVVIQTVQPTRPIQTTCTPPTCDGLNGPNCICPDVNCDVCGDCVCPPLPNCPGGIGSNCVVNQNCASGLSCGLGGICTCARPGPVTGITAHVVGNGQLNISWNATPGADSYNIILNGPTPQTQLYYVSTSISFTGLVFGIYDVVIFAVSANCGMSSQFGSLGSINVLQACGPNCACPVGQSCINGFCIGCQTNNDCNDGLSCINGTCTPCTSDCNCAPPNHCINGKCQECNLDSQCPNGTVCRAGKCVQCQFNQDCNIGEFCSPNNLCVGCLTNANCGGPTPFCNPAILTCQACLTTANCPSGFLCEAGTCVAIPI